MLWAFHFNLGQKKNLLQNKNSLCDIIYKGTLFFKKHIADSTIRIRLEFPEHEALNETKQSKKTKFKTPKKNSKKYS